MLWRRKSKPQPKPERATPAVDPCVARLLDVNVADVAHIWNNGDEWPRIDWSRAEPWIATQFSVGYTPAELRRAIMRAYLDASRDRLEVAHIRWSTASVEGLAPATVLSGGSLATFAQRAMELLARDLSPVLGEEPVADVAVVMIEPIERFFDFASAFFPDEGEFASFGGLYLREQESAGADMPIVALAPSSLESAKSALAHELTHHALRDCALPLWLEEGLTQVMEERITGWSHFQLELTTQRRHAEVWGRIGLGSFLDGSAFGSPEDDHQELAYHLAQWIACQELTRRPKLFFEFLRRCRELGPDDACREVLGVSPSELLAEHIRLSK